jgi:predicted acylesterase/phospholipase RssA
MLPHLFRNYGPEPEGGHPTIVNVALATSAAPLYFDPVTIAGVEYVDGGLGNNSPVWKVWDEAKSYLVQDTSASRECIVSLGTGKLDDISLKGSLLGLVIGLLYKATLSDADETFAAEHGNLVDKKYFRFNIPEDLKPIALEDPTKLDVIARATKKFNTDNATRLAKCARQTFQTRSPTVIKTTHNG